MIVAPPAFGPCPPLPSPDRFAANDRLRPVPAAAEAEHLVDAMSRRHCAGQRGRLSGSDILAALRAPPDAPSPEADAVRWMLGSVRVRDMHVLAWRCGVPIPALAAHVRSHGMTHQPLIRWLNQFAAPHDAVDKTAKPK